MAKRSKDIKMSESAQTVSVISLEKTIVQRAYDYSVKRGYDAALERQLPRPVEVGACKSSS